MKKAAVIFIFAVVVLSGCTKKTQKGEFTLEKDVLKVGVEIGYPPFEYYSADGKTPAGFDIQLSKEIAKRMGVNVKFIDTAWDGIFAGLDTSRYDVIVSAMTMTDARKANYAFSEPYIGNGQSIILRKDSALKITSPADLEGKKVGYQAECTSDFFMEKQSESGLNFVKAEYDKVLNAYDDLRLGRIDAVVSDYLVAVSYLNEKNSEFKAVWIGEPDEYFGICTKKTGVELLAKINSAMQSMKEDGTLKTMYMDVFGTDLSDSIK